MRAGRALREKWADDARPPCAYCGHAFTHRELQPSIDPVTFESIPHPDYKPLHFHCSECPCVLTPA